MPNYDLPKYIEYVVAAYGIFTVVFGGYALYLWRRTRAVRRALAKLEGKGGVKP